MMHNPRWKDPTPLMTRDEAEVLARKIQPRDANEEVGFALEDDTYERKPDDAS